ncbi:hypothetical protein N7495_006248 [Penicillium taxi]|uniref:uncharacterized protein n=1 Tax=Penicillium taxi TaxID=168475 RepID=UPI0025457C33|nr:uncharacterized protein N7495_006248 [Penicillium taxi]KAJ5894557.1 hypothetical protein N7495_006248 [Penicillium taxi]
MAQIINHPSYVRYLEESPSLPPLQYRDGKNGSRESVKYESKATQTTEIEPIEIQSADEEVIEIQTTKIEPIET